MLFAFNISNKTEVTNTLLLGQSICSIIFYKSFASMSFLEHLFIYSWEKLVTCTTEKTSRVRKETRLNFE